MGGGGTFTDGEASCSMNFFLLLCGQKGFVDA